MRYKEPPYDDAHRADMFRDVGHFAISLVNSTTYYKGLKVVPPSAVLEYERFVELEDKRYVDKYLRIHFEQLFLATSTRGMREESSVEKGGRDNVAKVAVLPKSEK